MLIRTLFAIIFLALAQGAQAKTIRLTIYDDGLSCPGNCDAHVVFVQSLNGTEFAHDPSTKHEPYSDCVLGQPCRICIESGGKQCLETTYRGQGPHKDTFDLTPAFYKQACVSKPAQPALAAQCETLKKAAAKLEGKISCIANLDALKCVSIIKKATDAKELDLPKYQRCKATGETKYNSGRPDVEKRLNDCAYEFQVNGRNTNGGTWRKLLPAACSEGTFVGPFGTDCCSGDPLSDGPQGAECSGFYVKP